MKNPMKSKRAFFYLILFGFALVALLFFHQNLLIKAGKFLTPQGMGSADVVIVESAEVIREKALKMGMRVLSSGRAHGLVVVYQDSENERIFGRPRQYKPFLTQKLEEHGLRKDQIRVIEVPKDHPITLKEAQQVLSNLSKEGMKMAILLTEGFHTRRSFWAYKQVGLPLGIEIIPNPYFVSYRSENWWQNTQGIYAFAVELIKFSYYLLCGYIPFRSLLMTGTCPVPPMAG